MCYLFLFFSQTPACHHWINMVKEETNRSTLSAKTARKKKEQEKKKRSHLLTMSAKSADSYSVRVLLMLTWKQQHNMSKLNHKSQLPNTTSYYHCKVLNSTIIALQPLLAISWPVLFQWMHKSFPNNNNNNGLFLCNAILHKKLTALCKVVSFEACCQWALLSV